MSSSGKDSHNSDFAERPLLPGDTTRSSQRDTVELLNMNASQDHTHNHSVGSAQTLAKREDEFGEIDDSEKSQTSKQSGSISQKNRWKNGNKRKSMNQSDLAEYVRSTIKQAECARYIPLKKDESDKCCCGRPKDYHINPNIDTKTNKDLPSGEWRYKEEPCDSFGEIHFRGFGSSTSNSPYVRVSRETDVSDVWTLMIDYWKMPLPRLLISVTGGAQRFEMKDRMRSLLKQGLVGTAVSTGGWLVTGGTAAGVMEFVGEAVRDHMTDYGNNIDKPCVALGIATWGTVANQIVLSGNKGDRLFPANYAMVDALNDEPRGFSTLDCNHTHFILVDDGTMGKYDREIDFRSELERHVAESQDISIPVVLVVVEGGEGTMETVLQSLKRKTPIVVVKGSGRAADFIAQGYELTRHPTSDEKTTFPKEFDKRMTQEAGKIFAFKENEESIECVKQLRVCLEERRLRELDDLQDITSVVSDNINMSSSGKDSHNSDFAERPLLPGDTTRSSQRDTVELLNMNASQDHTHNHSVGSAQTLAKREDEFGEIDDSEKSQTSKQSGSISQKNRWKNGNKRKSMNQSDLAEYVRSTIKQAECARYIPLKKDESDKCCCGRPKDYHINPNIDTKTNKDLPSGEWRYKEEPCDSFGEIHFRGFGSSTSNSPYVRVSRETDVSDVWTLMIDYWKMPLPRLLISVTGGAQRFEMKDRMRSLLKQGLVGTAVSTGGWLVTGGTAAGVMEFVGEAVRDHMTDYGNNIDKPCVALGIATWGTVANQIVLSGNKGDRLFPANYAMVDALNDEPRGFSTLDCNHTHFILVDDGTMGKYDREIDFRSELERHVAESQDISIPVVLVVVEGGEGTMETVLQSLKRKTPIVVVKGSGRAADFIAQGYELTRHPTSDEKTTFPKEFDKRMTQEAGKIFAFKENEESIECVKQLRVCLEERRLVNVVDLEKTNTVKDIDVSILCAILRANKGDGSKSQLALALAWNRCDIAQQHIFTKENALSWNIKDLYNAMFTALVQDQADFVKLFLDNGVDLHKFLTVETLWNLYCNCLSDDSDGEPALLRHKIMQVQQVWGAYCTCKPLKGWSKFPKQSMLILIGKVTSRLTSNGAFQYYSDPKKYRVGDNETVTSEWKGDIKRLQPYVTRSESSTGANQHISDSKKQEEKPDFEHPELDLFLLSVLFNRPEMAQVFLSEGQNQIGTALIGCSLLQALSNKAKFDVQVNISVDLENHAQRLEQFAIGVLTECYNRSGKDAHLILVRELPRHLGNTNLLHLTEQLGLMDFAENPACQTTLSQIWKGCLHPYTSSIRICLTLLIPPLVAFIKFRNEDNMEDGEEDEESASPRGWECVATRAPNVLYKFYTAPVTKLYANIMAYLVLLSLFSYFLLTNLHSTDLPNAPSHVEIVVWIWFCTMMIDEGHQVIGRDKRSLWYKIRSYWRCSWNKYDVFMYAGMIASIIMRFILTEANFVHVRILYSLTLAVSSIRLLQYFYTSEKLGPKVIMISRMLVDLVFFFLILLVFVLSFGVAYHINMFPNAPVSWSIFFNVLYYPYFQIYGELFLDNLKGQDMEECTHNETIWRQNPMKRCPEENAMVSVLVAFYMILTNILLVNLLIAMFSYTFQTVQDNSTKVWRFYRISLIFEYCDRPALVPPAIILNHIWRSGHYILHKYTVCGVQTRHNNFKKPMNEDEIKRLTQFEKIATDEHLTRSTAREREMLDSRVASIAKTDALVMGELQNIKETIQKLEAKTPHDDS